MKWLALVQLEKLIAYAYLLPVFVEEQVTISLVKQQMK
jgi:hypothetical protein